MRRSAARVILVDEADRVLLFRGWDPVTPEVRYWFTVGGGLRDGESAAEGAAREVAEETGLAVTPADLGAPVWRDVAEFPFDGHRYRQEQVFFLLRAPAFEIDTAGFDPVERRSIDTHRWWTVTELVAADEPVYPRDLPELMARLLSPAGGEIGGAGAAVADGKGIHSC